MSEARLQAVYELPQSAAGRTIMTTEPKFIPKEAAVNTRLGEDIEVKVRLIDCVGFLVEGAAGHIEDDGERMVKTPWFDHEIPFAQAAEIGTEGDLRPFHHRHCGDGRRAPSRELPLGKPSFRQRRRRWES